MKILIADKFSSKAIEELRTLGNNVTYSPDLTDDSLTAALKEGEPNVLVVRSTKVTAAMLSSSESLQLVVRAGAGVNTIDVDAASRIGIFVANCPGKNSIAVAELVMGLIIAIDRKIPENVNSFRQGKWNKKEFSKSQGLKGRSLGLIGFGNIAQAVTKRAQAFGMPVFAWSVSLTAETAEEYGILRLDSPLDVARRADIVSVHVAATKDTIGLCSAAFFDAMKENAVFINTSRGDIVDESALKNAITKKWIRAGLDVFAGEPSGGEADWKSPLAELPAVYGTHHIGASTAQAEDAIGAEALRIIKVFCSTGEVLNCVNIDTHTPATHIITVRHLNRVGVLAAILGPIRQADINVLEMENQIFAGDEAAIAKLRLNQEPSAPVLKQIKESNSAILSVNVTPVNT